MSEDPKQHGKMVPGDGLDNITRGNHILQRFPDVADEAARAAVTITAIDLVSVIRQTGGARPGAYLTKATGSGLDKWLGPFGGNVTQTGALVDNFITGATGADNGAGPGASGDDVGTLGGDGGDGTTGGGNAGQSFQTGGDGGDSTVSGNGGEGGLAGLAGGKGGAANGASGNGGPGGTVSFLGGDGGPASPSGTDGNGGGVEIDAGSGDVNGQVSIGTGNAREFISGQGNTKHQHRGGQYTPLNDLGSEAAAVTPDLKNSNVFKITLTGNVVLTFANLSDGQSGHIQVTQDGAGSRTMVKGAGVTMPGGAIALSGGAGDTDMLAYVVDGSTVRVWVEALNFS